MIVLYLDSITTALPILMRENVKHGFVIEARRLEFDCRHAVGEAVLVVDLAAVNGWIDILVSLVDVGSVTSFSFS